MSWDVTINIPGTGDVSLTNYSGENLVRNSAFKKTLNSVSKEFAAVTNQAWFTVMSRPALASALFNLDRDEDVSVVIQKDSADWFTGYVRPVTDFINTNSDVDTLEFECVDVGWTLHKKPSAVLEVVPGDGMKVCDTTTTSESLIHLILDEAWGGTFPNTVYADDISTEVDYLRYQNEEYFALLSDLCFSYHRSFYFDESGDFHMYNWGASSVSSSGTIDEDDMLGELKISREDEAPDTPEVRYFKQVTKSGENLCTITDPVVITTGTGVSVSGGTLTWNNGNQGPDGPHPVKTSDSFSGRYVIPEECQGVTASRAKYRWTWGRIDRSTGLIWATDSDHSRELWTTVPGNASSTACISTTATLDTDTYVASFSVSSLFYTETAYAPCGLIKGIWVYVDGIYNEEAGRAAGPDVGPGVKTFDAPYCFDADDAAEVATALSKNIENGEYLYKWSSRNNYSIGGYYSVSNTAANKISICRIAKKTHTVNPGDIDFYEYEATQYSGLGSVYDSVVAGMSSDTPMPEVPDATTPLAGPDISDISGDPLPEDGLYFFGDLFGFYDQSEDEWTSYLANDGTFKFQGDASNYIEWDGATFEIHGDLYCSGDSELQGTITAGNGIYSDNYNAGVAGWGIDGDGDAEFNTITIRKEALQANLVGYTSGIIIGYDGTGTTASPDEGDRRVLIDNDSILFEEYTGGAWSSENQMAFGGSDSDGWFYPFSSCRGVVHPQAEDIDTSEIAELLPGGYLYNLEGSGYLVAVGQTALAYGAGIGNAARSSTWSQAGTYSLCGNSAANDGAFGLSYIAVDGEYPTAVNLSENATLSAWMYHAAAGSSPSGTINFLSAKNTETTTGYTAEIAAEYVLSSNTIRLYANYNDGTDHEVTSTGQVISVGTQHMISVLWDASAETATLIVDDEEVESLDLSAETFDTFSSVSSCATSSTLGLIPTDATNPGVYMDEFVTCPGEMFDADVLIAHYNHDRHWSTSGWSSKDLVLRAAPGGRVRTDYPAGYIYGLETEAGTDSDHDVTIGAGKCRSYSDLYNLDLRSDMTKRIDATWAAGTNAGGLFSGSVAADTTYHLFLIRKDSDGSIDAGFDTDIDCVNIPSGYTAYRRIASFLTDSSANLIPWIQTGDRFKYSPMLLTLNTGSTTTQTSVTLDVPQGRVFNAIVNVFLARDGERYAIIAPSSETIPTPTATNCDLSTSTGCTRASQEMTIPTTTAAAIDYRMSGTTTSNFRVFTQGWIDDRGQYGGK